MYFPVRGAKTSGTPETGENVPNIDMAECLVNAELCEFQRTLGQSFKRWRL